MKLRRIVSAAAIAALVAVSGAGATEPTTITSAPPALTNSTTATFSFSAADAVSYECSLDGGAYSPCSSGQSYTVGNGAHGFSVYGLDGGAVAGAADSHSWTVDTTAPVLSLPANITQNVNGASAATVSYAASATDNGSPIAVSCSPASGASFSLGVTTVNCTSTDGAGNTASGSFTVTIRDTNAPTVTVPANITRDVNGVTSTIVTYSASASDGSTPLAPSCSPASGSSFTLGMTTVTCSATDAAGNTGSASFTVTVQDTTPPTVSISGGPSGTVNSKDAAFSFTVSEGSPTCSLDGGGFAPCGSPATYSGLADGEHTFSVRATDAAANAASASRTWSIDATPPKLSLSGLGSFNVIEADGPGGTAVTYEVTAADAGGPLLPGATSCGPKSGSLFKLGVTNIECKASDPYGNTASLLAQVKVVDTTPPSISAPDVTVGATTEAGIPRSSKLLGDYFDAIKANDLVSKATISIAAPVFFPVGKTIITVTAVDAQGNKASKKAEVTVLALGKNAPPLDLRAPRAPAGVKAVGGDHRVALSWRANPDVALVEIRRTVVGSSTGRKTLLATSGPPFVDKGLRNGLKYRYVLVAIDEAGNASASVVVTATPRVLMLARPKPDQILFSPPTLLWVPVRNATYFNVQLYRGKTKVLSAWPSRARLKLKRTWLYNERKQSLLPGRYTWYVWPGLGLRKEVRYASLLGKSTFVVKKKPAKKKDAKAKRSVAVLVRR